MISVIVPAYNEARPIASMMERLGPGMADGSLEVIVIANGCTDDTAEVARSGGATVIELGQGGKTQALNAGDAAASHFPRFYLDADIKLTPTDLLALAAHLEGDVLAVAPAVRIDSSASPWVLRAYHRVWERLPGVVESLSGRGCVGVSRAGRQRWAEFPSVIADDLFIETHFAPAERHVDSGVVSVVEAARDVRSFMRRNQRIRRGNIELEQLLGRRLSSASSWVSVFKDHPRLLPDAPAFIALSLVGRIQARWDDLRSRSTDWGHDASTR